MRVLEPVEKQVKYTNKPFIKLHQNPYFILMCSNTIYILNNTLIECFDIAFNETNKLRKEKKTFLSLILQKRNAQPHCQKWLDGKEIMYRAFLLVIYDNRIIVS